MSEDSRDLDAIDIQKIQITKGKTVTLREDLPKNDPFYHKRAALVAEFEREEAVWASLKKAPVIEDRVTPAPAKTLVAAVSSAPLHTPTAQSRSYFGGIANSIRSGINRASGGYFFSDES